MRAVMVLGLAMLTAGCSDVPHAWTEAELRDLAQDEARDVAWAVDSDLESRIIELEDQVDELQAQVAELQTTRTDG